MTAGPCGLIDCPVPDPTAVVDSVDSYTLAARTTMARAHRHRHDADGWPRPGAAGHPGRFSPLPDVAHAYTARVATAALLETALRDLTPSARTVFTPDLSPWAYTNVTTTADLRLADLRDPALETLGLHRDSLTAAPPPHYPCTGRWAGALHRAGFHGAIWHSRQADLHRDRRYHDGLAKVLLTHSAIEVMVLWAPPTPTDLLTRADEPVRLLDDDGRPARIVLELSALLGIVVEAGGDAQTAV